MPNARSRHRQLLEQLDRLTPEVRRDVERALERLQRRIPIGRIVAAVASGSPGALMALVSQLSADLRDAGEVLARAFAAGATSAGRELRVAASLTLTNPQAVAAAQATGARFVTGVTETTREGIRTIIARAFADGIAPRDAAALIRPMIGLNARQARAVLTRRLLLVARGMAADQVRQRVSRYASQLLRQRALLIARTEIIRASTDGQIALWRAAQQRGLLPPSARKQWLVTDDDRLCPRCQRMSGQTVPIDGLFQEGLAQIPGPPLHPACRCTVIIAPASLALRRAA